MTNKKRKDTFGNGLIAFLFICMIFLMGYAFKNPILLYSTNPEVEINHEYDPKTNIQQVFYHSDSSVQVSSDIDTKKVGNYTVTYQIKDYKKTVFLCVGGDARQTYTAQTLTKIGRVYTYGMDDKGEDTIPLAHLDQLTEKADVLVLPLMKADGLDISSSRNVKVSCSDVSTHLKKNALVAGGLLRRDQIEYFSSLGFDVKDYYKREELVIRNCIPTAEGALQIAMQELAVTVNGSTVLVIGYGRVAKACAKLFRAVGADVTISARKLSALAEAEGAGYKAELITALAENISEYTIIINTVPAMILDEKLLGVMDKNSLIIDLASRPGGVDHETAAKLNRRVVWALGLPAKAAPMTAGEIIARTVTDILNERGTKNVT